MIECESESDSGHQHLNGNDEIWETVDVIGVAGLGSSFDVMKTINDADNELLGCRQSDDTFQGDDLPYDSVRLQLGFETSGKCDNGQYAYRCGGACDDLNERVDDLVECVIRAIGCGEALIDDRYYDEYDGKLIDARIESLKPTPAPGVVDFVVLLVEVVHMAEVILTLVSSRNDVSYNKLEQGGHGDGFLQLWYGIEI